MSESEKPISRAGGRAKTLAVVIAVVVILVAMLFYRPIIRRVWPVQKSTAASSALAPQVTVKLAPGVADALIVEPVVIEQLRIKTATATKATLPIEIKLPGTLSLDSTQLEQVRCRFDGEVVEIGKVADGARPLQFGDSVKPGQLLAIVWSRELGEK